MSEPTLVHSIGGEPVYVLERRVVGQDWVSAPEHLARHAPRITFFSLKGGGGRSTALFLWGRSLVAQGKTVLLVDLDLEAPGLGAQLLLAYMLRDAGWLWVIAGFILFRLFDIVKPWPVSLADRNVGGGLGIMLDDIIAAVYAWVLLQLLIFVF